MRTVKKPEDRRKEIIDTAMALFIKKGYEKTTVEDITNAMEIAKGSFYYYFKTKQEVFEACISSLASDVIDSYRNILDNNEKPAIMRLIDYIEYNFELSERSKEKGTFDFVHSPTAELLHSKMLEQGKEKLMETFTQLIKSGVDDSNFQIMDPQFTAAALLGTLNEGHELLSKRKDQSPDEQRKLVYTVMGQILGVNIYECWKGKKYE
ncbi:TetR/AcrR family transcriptional regulator [Clostridium isatidis]|uniref:TetR/AcrR family transcriptional regulator n=1 Tax=Clostridium isatidis TaxID=182773 RepID=UPI003AAB2410